MTFICTEINPHSLHPLHSLTQGDTWHDVQYDIFSMSGRNQPPGQWCHCNQPEYHHKMSSFFFSLKQLNLKWQGKAQLRGRLNGKLLHSSSWDISSSPTQSETQRIIDIFPPPRHPPDTAAINTLSCTPLGKEIWHGTGQAVKLDVNCSHYL